MNRGITGKVACCVYGLLLLLATGGPWAGPVVAGEEPPRPDSPFNRDMTSRTIHSARVSDKSRGERQVTIDFNDVDLAVFIKYISNLTGKNFIIDKAVRGNVSIISPTRISIDEAYKVFESVLEVQGLTTVPAGSVTKIVPAVAARTKGIETGLQSGDGGNGDQVVTQLIPLQYADPENIKRLIVPLVSKTSVVASYPPTGMLIVTDYHSNLDRLMHIIREVDIPDTGASISVMPLRYATAADLAGILTNIFKVPLARTRVSRTKSGVRTPAGIKILADDRTNSLIVLAGEVETGKVKEVVVMLDREIPHSTGDNHVYYLQNANAEELVSVLTTLPGPSGQTAEKGKGPVAAPISKDVRIVADKATNSLVITAPEKDYLALEEVIKKLDIPRRMVYIEALIMEVNVEKDFRIGMELKGGFTFDDGSSGVFLGSRNSEPSVIGGLVEGTQGDLPLGLSLGVVGDLITIGNQTFPGIGAVLDAYKSDADVQIISTPQILTTDNHEAEIKVGENVPYLTRKDTSETGTDYSNYEYKDIGVTLKITPQINQEGVVRLEIFQEIIKLKSSDGFRPTTLTRSARTTVIVQDGHTVVIGGIIGDDVGETDTKVPLLGDIPLLGWLFKHKSNSRKKTNLYIFLTPHVIRNPMEAQRIYQKKKEEMGEHALDKDAMALSSESLRPAYSNELLLTEQAFRQLQDQDYARARISLEKALIINPDNPYALINMGVVCEAEGKPDQAAVLYERVLALSPDEQAVDSTNPEMVGQSLAAIARDNLARIRPDGR